MNELNKNNIAQETHAKAIGYYKQSEQFGYKFLMEVKKMRDDRLFEQLGFHNFDEYSRQAFGYSRNTMNERIQSAEAFGEDYNRALGSYGKQKARQLAQLPEDQREKVMEGGIDTDQGHKSVDEATTRELEEYKRKLKQSEEANKTLDGLLSEKADTINALEEQVKNKPAPEIVEKEIEKVPEDYEQLKQQASDAQDQLKKAQEDLDFYQKEVKAYERIRKNDEANDKFDEQQEHELRSLKVQTSISVYSLISDIQRFIREENVIGDISKLDKLDDETKERLQEANNGLQRFVDNVNQVINGRRIVEGEFSE